MGAAHGLIEQGARHAGPPGIWMHEHAGHDGQVVGGAAEMARRARHGHQRRAGPVECGVTDDLAVAFCHPRRQLLARCEEGVDVDGPTGRVPVAGVDGARHVETAVDVCVFAEPDAHEVQLVPPRRRAVRAPQQITPQNPEQTGRANTRPSAAGTYDCPMARTAAALTLASLLLCGCGVVGAVQGIAHGVEGNRATISAFTGTMKSGETATFVATYVTTGSAPATIVYAAQPPHGLAFQVTPSSAGGSAEDIVVNATAAYTCSRPTSGTSPWSCRQANSSSITSGSPILDLYTPSHWITFLDDFSLAAGFAGDRVTKSSMSVNGFSLQCVDFRAPGVSGTSTICTTAQGVLGYVQVASDSTGFEIEHYSTSPPPSLFEPPAGAPITTPTPTSTS
jgi:hypothetical protein